MAKTLGNLTPIFFTIFFFLTSVSNAQDDSFAKTLTPENLEVKPVKLTHLHFYYHDNITGPNPTAIRVAGRNFTNNNNPLTESGAVLEFGAVVAMDDPLTVGPEPSSKLVGRAQGIYSTASQTDVAFLMVLNYVFLEGKYNGTKLSILGRNRILSTVREMPIVGGSGVFRFARGYAQARTYSFNTTSGNAVMEYNVYVYHY